MKSKDNPPPGHEPAAVTGPPRPTPEQVRSADGKVVPDVIAPDLSVLFCGINPGLYSAATGHHFARPGNRFWPALHRSGFTDRLLAPHEERELIAKGCGITNLVRRASAAADELTVEELVQGARLLERKVRRHRPACVAILGLGAYRKAFRRPLARVGRQPETLAGALLWVLPNPSGLNAHYQLSALVDLFRELRVGATAR